MAYAQPIVMQRSRALVAAAVTALALLVVVAAVGTVVSSPTGAADEIRLAGVPEGVSLQDAGGRAVVVVRDGGTVKAYPAVVAPVADPLVWCARAGHFSTSIRASYFSVDGHRLGGPGPARLDEYAARVDGDTLVIGTGHRFHQPTLAWSELAAARFLNSDDVCPLGRGRG